MQAAPCSPSRIEGADAEVLRFGSHEMRGKKQTQYEN